MSRARKNISFNPGQNTADLDKRIRDLSVLGHEASLSLFLQTEATPPIYFLPKLHTAGTRKRLREQQAATLPPLVERLDGLAQLPPSTSDVLGPPEHAAEHARGTIDDRLDDGSNAGAVGTAKKRKRRGPRGGASQKERWKRQRGGRDEGDV